MNGLDIGLYSLFGQYEESLLRDFDLFAIDGTAGGKELDLAAVYDNPGILHGARVRAE